MSVYLCVLQTRGREDWTGCSGGAGAVPGQTQERGGSQEGQERGFSHAVVCDILSPNMSQFISNTLF